MEIGEYCTLSSCATLTYLPVTCAYCRSRFCQSHFLPLQHQCKAPGAAEADRTLSDTEILKRYQRVNARRKDVQAAGPGGESIPIASSSTGVTIDEAEEEPSRLPCQRAGCKRFSLHMDASMPKVKEGNQTINIAKRDGRHEHRIFTHAAPRCDRCRGFYCMTHRSAVSHGCAAPAPPTEGDKKRDAANERKKKAQEILNKHFPDRANRPAR